MGVTYCQRGGGEKEKPLSSDKRNNEGNRHFACCRRGLHTVMEKKNIPMGRFLLTTSARAQCHVSKMRWKGESLKQGKCSSEKKMNVQLDILKGGLL